MDVGRYCSMNKSELNKPPDEGDFVVFRGGQMKVSC